MIRTHLGRSRVRESRTLGSVGAKPNGLATRPSRVKLRPDTRRTVHLVLLLERTAIGWAK